jgi:pimeloyl-ACP methyl ester carboxylesterase
MAEPLIGTQGEEREALVAWAAANIGSHAGDGIAWGQRAMAKRPDRLAVLKGLDVPAAVVRGDADGIASAAEAESMARALGVSVETLGGVGHLAAVEAPRMVARIVAKVLADAESRRSA